MSKIIKNKILGQGILLLAVVLLSFPFLSFRDNGGFKILNGKVIQKGADAFYEVGKINIKFKDAVSQSGYGKFGINNLDAFISAYSISKIEQKHPLNPNLSKRKIGDEELAKIYQIVFEKTVDPMDFANDLKKQFSDLLDWSEPSFVYKADFIPNDPNIAAQWHISKINSYQAWDQSQGDTNIVIGIVDSGSDMDHPDLQANIKIRYTDPINGMDDDGNGFIDDWRGWDFYAGDNDPNIMPSGNNHGSHVSGCASQVSNNGVHGGGIGFKVKLLISKHTDDSNPESSLYNTDAGVVYCYQNGAKVINCSYGSSYFSSYSQTVMNNAWANGTVICASAGNGDANGIGQNWQRYPASYTNVVSVAATNSSDVKTTFSNFHTDVDVSAPGESILSTVFDNNYTNFSGTSMSAPITSGTVALIRSKYSSWTPAQVVDRLKLGVDSIYDLNPTYLGMLGTGRVNAYKCLSDFPIIKITSSMHNDSIYGNNDKVYDVNEVIPIAFSFKNTYVAGTNASIRLTTTDPNVEIVQDSVYIGSIPAYGTFSTTYANTFKVKAKSTCPLDRDVVLKVSGSASCYSDNAANTITVRFRQGFATHNRNNLKLALTSDGAIGKKAQNYGTGLLLGNGINNQIYEAGLMIGVSNTKVSDVSRREQSPANFSDTDFVALNTYTMTFPGIISAQDGNGKFNDNGAGSNKIGVEVTQESFAFTGANDSNYILIRYTIKNTNSTSLSNLYAGIFTFFQPTGINPLAGNISCYNSTSKVGYSYKQSDPNPYLGIAMMNTDVTVNFKPMAFLDIINGFTTAEKWSTLSSGIASDSIGPGGNAFTLSAGPLTIAANQTIRLGFAIVKGNNLGDLINNVNIAKTKYASVGIQQISDIIPKKYELMQNYPNPFNPVTKINFAIPKNEIVNIKIYDVLGREIMTLVNEKLSAGYYEFSFDGSGLSSGIYFYRMTTNSYSDIKRMVLVK
ncbi:MAG: S8 family peptidase [Ignavibacteriae bacterium]|nr:S8 family peptidase [Ignavibacteriota bacterium]